MVQLLSLFMAEKQVSTKTVMDCELNINFTFHWILSQLWISWTTGRLSFIFFTLWRSAMKKKKAVLKLVLLSSCRETSVGKMSPHRQSPFPHTQSLTRNLFELFVWEDYYDWLLCKSRLDWNEFYYSMFPSLKRRWNIIRNNLTALIQNLKLGFLYRNSQLWTLAITNQK